MFTSVPCKSDVKFCEDFFLTWWMGLVISFFKDLLLPYVRGGSAQRSDPVLSFIYHF